MRPAIVSGIVTGEAQVVTVPEVFADITVSSLSSVFPVKVTEKRK